MNVSRGSILALIAIFQVISVVISQPVVKRPPEPSEVHTWAQVS